MEFSQRGTIDGDSETEIESKIIETPEEDVNLIIEQHKEGETFEEEEHEKHENLMEYDIIIDDGLVKEETAAAEDGEHVEVVEEEHQFTVVEEDEENVSSVDYILPDRDSDEDCAMLDRVLNDEIAEAQNINAVKKKPGRKRVGSLIFICDECGNHITGRMAFDLHCRRHRGDKQFECE
ncbi:hypothetical protein KR093_006555 [Drosophila rubida]|uniref:C2H2-type domain-containing protein n=1 Tax=Drosophila rubida TaxID=30044 RepID=A0AAD4JTQ1_9MUSC|nr:hypothetical protein KR093_006555 [Drosophila rubida]